MMQLTRFRFGPSSRASVRVSPFHPGLGCDVGREVYEVDIGADRSQVDHRAAAEGPHLRRHGLGREEVVPQIDGERRVPGVRVHVGHPVATVVGRVVDRHRDRTELVTADGDGLLQCRDVRYVARQEQRSQVTGRCDVLDQPVAR